MHAKSSEEMARLAKDELQFNLHNIYESFSSRDENEDGTLSKEEFTKALEDDKIQAALHRGEIAIEDAADVFDAIDHEKHGSLNLEDFVEGCMRVRGTAKAKELFKVTC